MLTSQNTTPCSPPTETRADFQARLLDTIVKARAYTETWTDISIAINALLAVRQGAHIDRRHLEPYITAEDLDRLLGGS